MIAQVDSDRCAACGCCVAICPTGALTLDETRLHVDSSCTACGLCVTACPMKALYLEEPATCNTSLPCDSQYDVIVIGAGPAGSMAAAAAARAGQRVLLLEKRQEIGSPVRCAEGVAGDALRSFLEPDPRWISAHVSRARIHVIPADDALSMDAEGEEGYILERRVFDRALAEQAVAAGVTLRVKTPALGLLTDGGRICGVRVRSGVEKQDIAASVVIGADGVESSVGRWAGLTSALPMRDQMTCAQYLLAGIDIDADCLQYWISHDHAPGGYVWLFPKGEGIANVGLGIQADLADEPPIAALNRFIESQPALSCGHPVNLVAGGVPVAPPPERLVGDGVMLVGDAARQVDPLTGGGIIPAMAAGQIAGQTAAEAIAAGEPTAERLSAYQSTWVERSGRQLERNYRLRNRFPSEKRRSRNFLRVFAVAAAGK